MMLMTFSTAECLELVQYHNPEYWEVDLVKYEVRLLALTAKNNIHLNHALDALFSKQTSQAELIYLLASYQKIMNKYVEEYHEVVKKIAQVHLQLKHLGTNKTISDEDKEDLKGFYLKTNQKNLALQKELLGHHAVKISLMAVVADTVNPTDKV